MYAAEAGKGEASPEEDEIAEEISEDGGFGSSSAHVCD